LYFLSSFVTSPLQAGLPAASKPVCCKQACLLQAGLAAPNAS